VTVNPYILNLFNKVDDKIAQYIMKESIGKGAYGSVFKCINTATNEV
jgi:hypothetical protein